jgi:hypothetical protein
MMILRATSILGGQKENKRMMCSITHSSHSNAYILMWHYILDIFFLFFFFVFFLNIFHSPIFFSLLISSPPTFYRKPSTDDHQNPNIGVRYCLCHCFNSPKLSHLIVYVICAYSFTSRVPCHRRSGSYMCYV